MDDFLDLSGHCNSSISLARADYSLCMPLVGRGKLCWVTSFAFGKVQIVSGTKLGDVRVAEMSFLGNLPGGKALREEEENVGDLVLGEGFHDGRGWSLSWFCAEQSQFNLNIDCVKNFPCFR